MRIIIIIVKTSVNVNKGTIIIIIMIAVFRVIMTTRSAAVVVAITTTTAALISVVVLDSWTRCYGRRLSKRWPVILYRGKGPRRSPHPWISTNNINNYDDIVDGDDSIRSSTDSKVGAMGEGLTRRRPVNI